MKGKHLSRVSLDLNPRGTHRGNWGRKDEEYCADFILVARRVLNDEEYQVFKWHFLLGADWRLVERKTGISRSHFFHHVYRLEQKLGLTFHELRPYPLHPLEDYFFNNKPHEDPLAAARRFFERHAA